MKGANSCFNQYIGMNALDRTGDRVEAILYTDYSAAIGLGSSFEYILESHVNRVLETAWCSGLFCSFLCSASAGEEAQNYDWLTVRPVDSRGRQPISLDG